MMPNVRDASFLAEKWQRNAQNAAPNYTLGVQNPKKNWAEETAKAEDRWAQGVQDAINRKAFGAGVRKAGIEAWQQGAVLKGSQRYQQGVALAKETWQRELSIPQWCDCCRGMCNASLGRCCLLSIPQWCDCCKDG